MREALTGWAPGVRVSGSAARLLAVALVALSLGACSPTYVLRLGYEQAKILSRREPIDRLVRDPATAENTRNKLSLVVEARDFAADSLGLDVGRSYTTFAQLDSDTLIHVVSAAHPDRFAAHTWWFPIVGNVPYKGFFSLERAQREAERLAERGFDTYLRPAGAFSTLGWFNDPLYSTLLRYDSVSLGNTVIHELVHNTIYLSGQAMFNESFAQFVGSRGAIAFFCSRYGDQARECGIARMQWEDELLFGAHMSGLVGELEALYSREDVGREEKLTLRQEVFARWQRAFREEVQPRLQVSTYGRFATEPLNNATLIGRRLYYGRLELFEAVFQRSGGELRSSVDLLLEAANARPRDPYGAVEELLASLGPGG